MEPRYYNIEQMNKEKPGHKKRVIIIVVATIIAAIIIGIGGVMVASATLMNSASVKEAAELESAQASAQIVNLGETLRQTTVDAVINGESIPMLSREQVYKLDLSVPSGVTVADLKLCTKGNLVGLEEAFWQVEQDYDINCLFVMAIASHESANGTICFRPNNMFGYGRSGFSSKAEGIDVVARALANSYLRQGGSHYQGKTIEAVHRTYAASSTWDDKVAHNMVKYYAIISQSHNKGIENLK